MLSDGTSVRPEREFWPLPELDCYNLAGIGTRTTPWPDP